jgi:signal transduction histidine kinase
MASARLPIAAWRRLGLRTRLSVGYAASLSLLLFVYAALVYAVAYERLSVEVDHRLDQEVELAERSLFVDASGQLVWRPAAASADFETLPNMLWIDVHRADASLLHRSLGGYARGGRVEPLAFQVRPSGFFTVEMPNGARLRVLQRSLTVDGQVATVRVAYAEEQIRRDLASFLLVLAVGMPLAVIAASLAGYWLAGHALAPVARMTEEARAITADHLDARLPVPTAMDELGQLATTFNDLFARLERSFEQMRRFTADASHELRTPLTVIRSVGEVAMREPHTEAEYRDTIGTMLEEVERLTLLTTTLLELTRAEGGRVSLKREPFDLRDLARDAAAFIAVLAEEAGVRLELDLPAAAIPVIGDWTTLRQATINLVDNAIKHGSRGPLRAGGRPRVRPCRRHRRAQRRQRRAERQPRPGGDAGRCRADRQRRHLRSARDIHAAARRVTTQPSAGSSTPGARTTAGSATATSRPRAPSSLPMRGGA